MKIKCKDCGNEFIFTEEEEKWYENMHFVPPVRCKACRQRRKNLRGGDNYGNKKENYCQENY
jgi:DNA-directed RNA polymerase subunit RPC12/RpoP